MAYAEAQLLNDLLADDNVDAVVEKFVSTSRLEGRSCCVPSRRSQPRGALIAPLFDDPSTQDEGVQTDSVVVLGALHSPARNERGGSGRGAIRPPTPELCVRSLDEGCEATSSSYSYSYSASTSPSLEDTQRPQGAATVKHIAFREFPKAVKVHRNAKMSATQSAPQRSEKDFRTMLLQAPAAHQRTGAREVLPPPPKKVGTRCFC